MSSTVDLLTMNSTDAAWAAGFLDGEGCIMVGTRDVPVVVFTSTDLAPLERLRELFGGSLAEKRQTEARRSQTWDLHVRSALRVRPLLETVMPYLVAKREQAEVLLAFCKTVVGPGERLSSDTKQLRRELDERLRGMKSRNRLG
jgi:hypothetical protein